MKLALSAQDPFPLPRPRRSPGGQFGNLNALKHGFCSRQFEDEPHSFRFIFFSNEYFISFLDNIW